MSEKSVPLRPNPTDPPIIHRQAAVRYAPSTKTTCQILGVVVDPVGPVKLLDVSATGLSLLTSQRYEAGMYLAVELKSADGDVARMVLMRIVHVKEYSPTNYVVGGAFTIPLTGSELQSFLTAAEG